MFINSKTHCIAWCFPAVGQEPLPKRLFLSTLISRMIWDWKKPKLKQLLCCLEGKFNSFTQDYRMKVWRQQKTEVVFFLRINHQRWAELCLKSISTKEVKWALKHPFFDKLSWYCHLILFFYSSPTYLLTFHAIWWMESQHLEEGTVFLLCFWKPAQVLQFCVDILRHYHIT